MEFYMKLPRNWKEKAMFIFIVSFISVNIIGPIISLWEMGWSVANYLKVLHVLPFIWIAVILVVLLAEKPATFLKEKITHKDDSFKTQIWINTLCNVFIISALMTIIGSAIGQRSIPMHTLKNFFEIWSRNFGLALLIEGLIAQPIARLFMQHYHLKTDRAQ